MNVTLFGERVIADGIKDLEVGDYAGLSEWALNAVLCIHIRGRQREICHFDTLTQKAT